jgi:hypothetical protein
MFATLGRLFGMSKLPVEFGQKVVLKSSQYIADENSMIKGYLPFAIVPNTQHLSMPVKNKTLAIGLPKEMLYPKDRHLYDEATNRPDGNVKLTKTFVLRGDTYEPLDSPTHEPREDETLVGLFETSPVVPSKLNFASLPLEVVGKFKSGPIAVDLQAYQTIEAPPSSKASGFDSISLTTEWDSNIPLFTLYATKSESSNWHKCFEPIMMPTMLQRLAPYLDGLLTASDPPGNMDFTRHLGTKKNEKTRGGMAPHLFMQKLFNTDGGKPGHPPLLILEVESQEHYIVTNILYRINRDEFVIITNEPREYSRSIMGIIEELYQRHSGIGVVEYELYPEGLLQEEEAKAMTPGAFSEGKKPDSSTLGKVTVGETRTDPLPAVPAKPGDDPATGLNKVVLPRLKIPTLDQVIATPSRKREAATPKKLDYEFRQTATPLVEGAENVRTPNTSTSATTSSSTTSTNRRLRI